MIFWVMFHEQGRLRESSGCKPTQKVKSNGVGGGYFLPDVKMP